MKKHNTLKVVLLTTGILFLCTWIFKTANLGATGYEAAERMQMGVFDLFNYQITAMQYFGYIALFVLVVGAFYAVLNETGAYRGMLDKLASKFKKKGKIVLVSIMVILAFLVSFFGMQLPLVIFIPFLVSLILLMGYDKVTAVLTVVGSMMIGLAGTTFGYNNTAILNQVLGLNNYDSVWIKLLILVLGIVLLAFNTVRHIANSDAKRNELKADKEEYVPEEKDKKRSYVPLIVIFAIIFVVTLLSVIPWQGAFAVEAFNKATEGVTNFKLFGFPIFAKVLGTFNSFGNWTVMELGILLAIMSLVIKFIYNIKFDDYLDAIARGAKKALKPAVLVILIYAILVMVTYHPFQLAIYNAILGTKFNIFGSGLAAILSSLINVDAAYVFQTTVPIIATQEKADYSLIYMLFQSVYGVIMLVAPTSLILMGTLSYLNIPYGKWLKTVWKLLLELLVVLLILFLIFGARGSNTAINSVVTQFIVM